MAIRVINLICPVCGVKYEKSIGHYNRAIKIGLRVFCSKICAGIGRRKTIEEKKAVKAAYDKKIYATKERKEARARYFKKAYKANPEKYRDIRKKKYKKHLEYLRTPEYKAWKKKYDIKYRCNKEYGEYGEAAILLFELEKLLKNNMPTEMKFQMGITNKTQKRKRLWQKTTKNSQQQTSKILFGKHYKV